MIYINMKSKGMVETIDEFTTRKEARTSLEDYRMAYHGQGQQLYTSNCCTKEWKESAKSVDI